MALDHLLWIPAAAVVGFGCSFVFGDLLTLPVDLHYLVYFGVVVGFLALYARVTELDVPSWIRPRWLQAVGRGVVGGIVLAQGALVRPETAKLSGATLAWALLWRGLAYGAVPTLLSANPVASPISHVFLHVTAVVHSPESELYLPPHRTLGGVPAP